MTVPDRLDDDAAAFAPIVADALHAARRVVVPRDRLITVLGDGRLGLILAQLLVRQNPLVRLIGRYSEKLALAERWGIRHRHVDDIGLRQDQDLIFDCTDSPAGFDIAVELVRPQGTIVTMRCGNNEQMSDPRHLESIVTRELTIIGSRPGAGPSRLGEALSIIVRREIDVVSLIQRRFSLREATLAYRVAGSPGTLGVMLMP